MEKEDKIVIALLITCAIFTSLLVHSSTRGKQALMRELNSPVSYFEAMGLDKGFIHGRIFERINNN